MKKWICKLLCLSMLTGLVSIHADASMEKDTVLSGTGFMNTKTAAIQEGNSPHVETSSVETDTVETPVPASQSPAPIFTGNKTVNDEKVFVTTENNADQSCVITGYKGDMGVTTLYIPLKIGGKTVRSVAEGTFAGCAFLKNVVVCGETEFQGAAVFAGSGVEIWAASGSKAQAYAAEKGLAFHAAEGPSALNGKKAASLNRVTLTWGAVPGAVSYQVYRKKGKESFSLFANTTATSVTNEKLKAGSTYSYRVSPVFAAANGDRIEGLYSKTVSVALKPSKLKKVKAKGVRGGIQVRWSRNKNVSGYQVYMKVHVKGFKTKFDRVKTIRKNKITGYRNKMLVRGMKYSYKVRAFKKVKGKNVYGPFVTVTAKAK